MREGIRKAVASADDEGMRWFLLLGALLIGCDADLLPFPDVKDVSRIQETRIFRARLEIERLETEVAQYHVLRGEWPESWRALRRGGLDPWGAAYILDLEGEQPVVYSAGPDGKPGTADDIYKG